MKNKKIFLVLFIALMLAQLIVPAYMIVHRELVLHNGKQYKFRVQPVDPYHPLRGRYVSVHLGDLQMTVPKDEKYYGNQAIYALITIDDMGYARFTGISRTVPENGEYIKTKVAYVYDENGGQKHVQIEAPFDRYYMEEKMAPQAEREYNKHVRDRNDNVYVTVKVLSGSAVLERLYIEGMTIEDYIKSNKG
ncbi:MAG: GDYXXLXY domain-containing protein [Clostridia bacterium]|nr:GDYXXLXY domain-containing protein [Clostridia bacterium]